jgi:hypothetical protein
VVSRARLPVTVVTASGLEYSKARRALGASVEVLRAGIALRERADRIDGIAISCGVAGALVSGLPTGTVLVPQRAATMDGVVRACDTAMSERLRAAAHELGCEPVDADLLTSATLVRGAERSRWAARGYAAVDMETALIDADAIACVRVVLDTPEHEISAAWLSPVRAALTPAAWRDLPFLLREAPRCAALAAAVIARAIGSGEAR